MVFANAIRQISIFIPPNSCEFNRNSDGKGRDRGMNPQVLEFLISRALCRCHVSRHLLTLRQRKRNGSREAAWPMSQNCRALTSY